MPDPSVRPWYIVGRQACQIAPDEWEVGPVVLRVAEATTIGEIREWAAKRRLLSRGGEVTLLSLSMDETEQPAGVRIGGIDDIDF